MRSIYHSVRSRSTGNCLFFLNIACTVHCVESAYKIILTCPGIYKQAMRKISSCVFRHSMGAILRQPSCSESSAFEMTRCMQHSYTLRHVLQLAGFYSVLSVHTHITTRTLPIFGCQGGPWTIAYHLVPSDTAYTELVEISPLLF